LNSVAKANGKLYFGTAVDNSELSDSTLAGYLADTKEFGQITPGNSMKWDATEPSRGSFSFSGGDVISNLAKKNGQLLRAHTLLWHSQLPNWVTSTQWSKADLTTVIEDHIAGVAGYYKGIPYAWDVVNEPVADDGTWRQSVFYTTFNDTGFIDVAFKAARAADPNAKLYLNEYNLEYAGAKFNTLYALVKTLVANGIPIDGVGFQAHMIVGSVPTDIGTRLKAFTDLGLEVAFTELDIRMTLPATEALYQQQKKDYQTIVSACAQLPKCVGVTIWGFTDAHSWIPSTFSGQGAALVWDSNYSKKPAYDGIIAAFTS
jgi:endo-1,4-beta-xylanase